jgi:hypothetical protein
MHQVTVCFKARQEGIQMTLLELPDEPERFALEQPLMHFVRMDRLLTHEPQQGKFDGHRLLDRRH